MSLQLKPGTRLFGAACSTELIVIRAPADAVDLRIGGHAALARAADRAEGLDVSTPADAASALGKRYVNAGGTLEVLCTKPGAGAIAVGEELCALKDSKPLPSSD